MEGEEIITQDLFTLKHHGVDDDGRLIVEHRPMGIQPLFVDKLAAEGVQLPPDILMPEHEDSQPQRVFW
ncbi:MAG: hypothetical protein U9R79_21970 [Armatimonadota bacterium]|nr:hypothetical protein [Armatimonadota bacterium]